MSSIYKAADSEKIVKDLYQRNLEFWPQPNEQKFVMTCMGKTFVIVCGPIEAPPLVLVHGTMANSAAWLNEVQQWSKSFRVYAVDIPGDAGLSNPERVPLKSKTYAIWMKETMDALGISKAFMVGISLGAWIAMSIVVHYSSRVIKLVLLSPAGIGPIKNILLWALPLLLLGSWGQKKVIERILGPLAQHSRNQNQILISDMMTAIFKHVRPRTEVAPIYSDNELKSLPMPVLVVVGAKDVTIDTLVVQKRVLDLIPKAEVHCLNEAGHYLGNQANFIGNFLRRK